MSRHFLKEMKMYRDERFSAGFPVANSAAYRLEEPTGYGADYGGFPADRTEWRPRVPSPAPESPQDDGWFRKVIKGAIGGLIALILIPLIVYVWHTWLEAKTCESPIGPKVSFLCEWSYVRITQKEAESFITSLRVEVDDGGTNRVDSAFRQLIQPADGHDLADDRKEFDSDFAGLEHIEQTGPVQRIGNTNNFTTTLRGYRPPSGWTDMDQSYVPNHVLVDDYRLTVYLAHTSASDPTEIRSTLPAMGGFQHDGRHPAVHMLAIHKGEQLSHPELNSQTVGSSYHAAPR